MEIETTFGFSLYVVPLQVVSVVYFRRVYGKLRGLSVKIVNGGLHFFSIFRTTQVRVYQSCCHKLIAKSQD